jgi:ribosomal protein S18 acetylase RimI-like enzyme
VQSVLSHLNSCKDSFIPALDTLVNIQEYSGKLVENSVTFEAWVGNTLVGLVAAYFNDKKNESGFITNISVIKQYAGKGLATELLKKSIFYGKQKNFKDLSLEVFFENKAAIRLYKKNQFYQTGIKNDFIFMKKYL